MWSRNEIDAQNLTSPFSTFHFAIYNKINNQLIHLKVSQHSYIFLRLVHNIKIILNRNLIIFNYKYIYKFSLKSAALKIENNDIHYTRSYTFFRTFVVYINLFATFL